MSEMQNIQWFPGHMTKTKRQIQASLKLVDAVAEILDARIPLSSKNPDLQKLIQNKPKVVLLNKCDMANQTATSRWIDYYASQGITAIAVDCKSGKGLNKFAPAVNNVLSERRERLKAKGMVNPMLRIMIVGIPNVGKSTLFNKLIGQRLSIVDDTPGVTRDRIYGEVEWLGKKAFIIDTGGIEPKSDDIILSQMRRQAQLAIDTANVIILVTDGKTGMVATDMDIAQMLMKSNKPIVLCVNKCDGIGEPTPEFYEFYNLGLGDPIQVSSVHGHGTGDLLDNVFEHLDFTEDSEDDGTVINVAVIGKPNAGKSSLINKITNEERCIVSDIAGTTRDTIDTMIENKYGKFNFTDTAGLRRQNKIYDDIEKYSIIRAKMAIERSDVCVIMIDAEAGVTEQDTKVAGLAHEAGKACILAVNKWDAIEKNDKTMQEFRKKLDTDFAFMSYAPKVFISAKTGQRIDRLFEFIVSCAEQSARRITTGMLNELLAQATTRVQPPSDKGKRLKIFYVTQASVKPPTFIFFCNNAQLFHFSYQRYLENRIREAFGLEGTPIRIIIRERGEK